MKSKSIREEIEEILIEVMDYAWNKGKNNDDTVDVGNRVWAREKVNKILSKLTQLLDEIPCEEIDPTKDKLLKDLESLHDPSYPYVDRIGEIRGHNQKAQEVREWRDKKKGEL